MATTTALAVANGERTPGLGPEQPHGPPAPAAPTPRSRHVAEVAGRRLDLLKTAVAALQIYARAAGALGHRRATFDGAARPRPRHAAPASGARRCRLFSSRQRALCAAAILRSPAAAVEKKEKGREKK